MSNLHLDGSYDAQAYIEALKEDFNARALTYDSGTNGAMHHDLNAELLSFYPFQSPVLDVGCGTGYFCGLVAGQGGEVVGIDVSPEMVKQARKTLVGAGDEHNLRFVAGRAEALPFAPESFGSVYVCSALGYFLDIPGTLRGFHRVLKPGGFFAYQSSSGDSSIIASTLEKACQEALGEERGKVTFRVPNTVTDTEIVNRQLMTHAGFCDIKVKSSSFENKVSVAFIRQLWNHGLLRNALLGRIKRLNVADMAKVRDCFWKYIDDLKEEDGTVQERLTNWFVQGWKGK